ncbi:type II toxin-antitoxin system RelB/DinJ family antitoxin (plasmid) [Ligilactobacillus salivarius]|uniref:Type II toxin-antitoxin system RelB/DinJ family antitoxin n=1 Tax=Ligilactobacillus salivarius TaxID=1624 RepID=A0ABD7YWX0_9LACO|nr:type II toxin-antitoxin system RelB/DinJ family antitoxin [Ligilactobacillus salivarius]WHS05080.1 type II toxin-antitoxin system RelB/DinJ family antitoxin [Ligilactobacillus salivarius]WHS09168.1 type II toxin-antitoxin system RelB/DinJ family antitoxin [Ligilactobacillus salivarius]WHS11189.1 type II toxin-antitoxin system RelB/DinJ family antitoxin [Ligilactobacillus salivarius]WHS15193.1 type II toxin-antitoxin system RelB/DinJ family antitoxin [Ligilactobacillus salivarius]WHS18617.1 
MANSTKRVQVNIDKKIAKQAELVLEMIGLNPTTAINLFYRQIAASGEVPLSLSLTKEQKRELLNEQIKQNVANIPTDDIDTDEELMRFFDED